MAILLSDDELGALEGLSHLAFRVYVSFIRTHMDIKSGLVGVASRISYQAMREWCYVEPVPGVRGEPVSVDMLYRVTRALERAGLVQIRSAKAEKRLIFWCPLAQQGKSVQKQAATRPRLEAATDEASINAALQVLGRDFQKSQAATHLLSELTEVYQSSSSTSEAEIRPPQGGAYDPLVSIAPQRGADGPQIAETTSAAENDLFSAETLLDGLQKVKVDHWPSALSNQQRGAIAAKLVKVSQDRHQIVVDELAGFIGRSHKPVMNPVRYVDFIISKAVLPVWFPEVAGQVSSARIAAENHKKRVSQAPDFAPRGVPAPADVRAQINSILGRVVV